MRRSWDVSDPETGRMCVVSRRCDTCIFRRDGPFKIDPERIATLISDAVNRDSFIVCHSTIYQGKKSAPAVCHGFWKAHRRDTLPLRLAVLLDFFLFRDPPDKEQP